MLEDLKDIEKRNENILILGDLNRGIGAGDLGVEGNKPQVSYGGQLLRDLLATNKYVLLNKLPMAKGGVWTWVDRSNPETRSCLDLGIVSAGLAPFVQEFQVDSEKVFTPRRVRRTKKGMVSTYTDHFKLCLVASQGLESGQRKPVKICQH